MAYDWTSHDYHAICPRITLTDRAGRHCGEPDTDGCKRCLAKNGAFFNLQQDCDIVRWRADSHEWLAGARRVFVPHHDVGERLARYFPDIAFTERGHLERLSHARHVAAFHCCAGQPLRIALLGTLNSHKGCEVLLQCARDARRRDLPLQFVVLGTSTNAAELLAAGVEISGEYGEQQVFDWLAARACHCALFLSTCPESYCYTLSIAQAGGLYSLAFDLGAQGARVRESRWGEVLPVYCSPPAINHRLLKVTEKLHRLRPASGPVFASYPSILRDYYGLDKKLRPLEDRYRFALPLTERRAA